MTTISGHTTRATGTILTAAIYNFDHNNHVNNANALNTEKVEGVTPPVAAGNFISFADTGGANGADSGFNSGSFVQRTGDTMTGALNVIRSATASTYFGAVCNDDGAATGPQITTSRVSASPAVNDLIGKYIFRGRDSGGNDVDYASFQGRIDDPTDGTETGSILLIRRLAGVDISEIVQTAGKQSIWLPAGAWKPMTTNPPASVTLEVQASNSDIFSLDFDPTNAEFAWTFVHMPKSWNVGQISGKILWAHPATVTNFGVTWQFAAHAVSNDDSMNFSHTAAASVTDTGGTTNDLYITAETSSFTIAGSPVADDLVILRVARIPTDGGDTMAVDAKFLGLTMYYTTDKPNDR